MGKFETKKKKSKKRDNRTLLVIILLMIAIALAGFVIPTLLHFMKDSDPKDPVSLTEPALQDDPTDFDEVTEPMASDVAVVPAESNPIEDTESTETEISNSFEAVTFPLLLEDGRLEIENAIQFDGFNPDCGNQEGYNIAALTVRNVSETYLSRAEISMTSDSGAVVQFVVSDLPSGKSTIAFATDNATTDAEVQYGDVVCSAVFDPDASMNEDMISVSVDGIQIVLQNNTDEQIDEVVVYCRSTLGDQYFGGISYMYTVNNLPANGTAEVAAVDCILGLAEVVRIVINEP